MNKICVILLHTRYELNFNIFLNIFNFKKPIIGTIIDTKLNSILGDSKVVQAKVDTGAFSSSIDKGLLEELGVIEPINLLNDPEFILEQEKPEYQNRGEVDKEARKKILEKYPSIKSIGRIYSSNGHRLTPFFELDIEIEGKNFKTIFNISDRKKLEYPIILGRKALKGFLVDVEKDYDKHIKKFYE